MCFKRPIVYSIISLSLLVSSLGEAHVYLWPAIIKSRGEINDSQALELRSNQWPSLGLSFTFGQWIINLDSSQYSHNSDNGNVSIETNYSDVGVWGGYRLFMGEVWDFYAVVGTAVYQQKVETSINNLSTTNKSHDRSLVGMGGEYLLKTPFNFSFVGGARLNWTQDLDPEIMPEFYLKLGVGF